MSHETGRIIFEAGYEDSINHRKRLYMGVLTEFDRETWGIGKA